MRRPKLATTMISIAVVLCLLPACYFGSSDTGGSSPTGKVSGTIVNKDGAGIEGVIVSVNSTSSYSTSYKYSTQTDGTGHFSVNVEDSVTYLIVASKAGYQDGSFDPEGTYVGYYDTITADMVLYSPTDYIDSVAADHWKGEYFANTSLSGTPVAIRDDGTGDLSFAPTQSIIHPRVGSTNFSVRWTRDVLFGGANYDFTVTNDDGFRYYIDNVLLIDSWTTNMQGGTISKTITPGTHQVKVEFNQGTGPWGLKLAWKNVYRLALSQDTSLTRNSGLSQYGCGLAYDTARNLLWLSGDVDDKIRVFDASGIQKQTISTIKNPANTANPTQTLSFDGDSIGIAYNQTNGHLFFVSPMDRTKLYECSIDDDGSGLYSLTLLNAWTRSNFRIEGMAWDSEQNCFWVASWDNRIYKMSSSGVPILDFACPGNPVSIAVDGANLFVVKYSDKKIAMLDKNDGSLLATLSMQGSTIATPYGMCLAGNQSFWVLDYDGNPPKLNKLTISGSY